MKTETLSQAETRALAAALIATDDALLAGRLAEAIANAETAKAGASGAFVLALEERLTAHPDEPLAGFIENARPILEVRVAKTAAKVYLSQASGLADAIDNGFVVGTRVSGKGEITPASAHAWRVEDKPASLKAEYDAAKKWSVEKGLSEKSTRAPGRQTAKTTCKTDVLDIPHGIDEVMELAHDFARALLVRLAGVSAGPAVELVKAAHIMERATKTLPRGLRLVG